MEELAGVHCASQSTTGLCIRLKEGMSHVEETTTDGWVELCLRLVSPEEIIDVKNESKGSHIHIMTALQWGFYPKVRS